MFHTSTKLDGCILGTNTKVGAKAELSRCVTQAGYEVGIGGKNQSSLLFLVYSYAQNHIETRSWMYRTGRYSKQKAKKEVRKVLKRTTIHHDFKLLQIDRDPTRGPCRYIMDNFACSSEVSLNTWKLRVDLMKDEKLLQEQT
jgi:hypothetical protein